MIVLLTPITTVTTDALNCPKALDGLLAPARMVMVTREEADELAPLLPCSDPNAIIPRIKIKTPIAAIPLIDKGLAKYFLEYRPRFVLKKHSSEKIVTRINNGKVETAIENVTKSVAFEIVGISTSKEGITKTMLIIVDKTNAHLLRVKTQNAEIKHSIEKILTSGTKKISNEEPLTKSRLIPKRSAEPVNISPPNMSQTANGKCFGFLPYCVSRIVPGL